MNKNAIQKYAIWARNELIAQVKQRAYLYGINEKNYGDENADAVNGRILSASEKAQRKTFIEQIKDHGFQQAVEEVAYTWFNRFAALRYMEVNDYLPTHIRVFSDVNGAFNPEILKDVLHLDLDGLDKAKVAQLLNANATDELYRYLLLTQCNALNAALPEMFERMGGYTEMLLPNNILKADGVIGRLVSDIPEEDWRDAVQIIGWMYQYYNTEPKQAVFDGLKKNVKITKEKIPAATQLFTPDWIVRYMVENSLGRLWIEHLESNRGFGFPMKFPLKISDPRPAIETLKSKWKYYLDEAEQDQEVAKQLHMMRAESRDKRPEDISFIDPCMGSGHILVYAFDVLMQIYESAGYSQRDAAKLILEKNIYGLDIDRRAYQLAYFSLMMKARQYNRRIFSENVKPQVYHPAGWCDGEEYGSLLKVDDPGEIPQEQRDITLFDDYERDLRVWNFKRLLSQKYDVVVTNPPYMGSSGMNGGLAQYVKDNFPDSKSDASTAFMEQVLYLCQQTGFMAMINIPVWMFLASYEKLRQRITLQNTIINMLHLGRGIFGSDFGSTSFVIAKTHIKDYVGSYRRLFEKQGAVDSVEQKEKWFFEGIGKHTASADNFAKIPGGPVAYWGSRFFFDGYKNPALETFGEARSGLQTGNNDLFLKYWFEVFLHTIAFNMISRKQFIESGRKWIPQIKGGEYRKWYGNFDYVVNWENDGAAIRECDGCRLNAMANDEFYFASGVTWSHTTASVFGARILPKGYLFNVEAPTFFPSSIDGNYVLGFLNSSVSQLHLNTVNPTLHYLVGNIKQLPLALSQEREKEVLQYVESNITLSRADWDSFETSWDFKRHPLIQYRILAGFGYEIHKYPGTIQSAFDWWKVNTERQFTTLKSNEEELNRIFIDIYSLQDELTPEVEDKDVTVRRADLGREIRSLISYAVGCMFGRYSLDVEGLAYAGGEWDESKYTTITPDRDNILPICDDEYFDDDLSGRFVDFVRVVYGAETLEENLRFIADALGGRGTPREVIRNYFLNDFFKDHCKIYQKRPIYWLFDSGRKNGFKALMYLHRYQSDLLAKLRTDYVHEQQERYRTQLKHISDALNTAAGAERARLLKQQEKLTAQAQEIAMFEEKVHHLADMNIEIDLDDGVKRNYEIFADVLAKI